AESGAMGDIVAASNPAGAADDDGLLVRGNLNRIRFAVDLEMNYEDETGNDAPEGASIQTIKVSDDRQVVFATVDRGNSKGAIARTERMGRTLTTFSANGMLVAPKGFDVVEEFGVIVVADFGGAAIKVFGIEPDDNNRLPLLFTIDDLAGEGSVWDVLHDPTNDRLYAAGTEGTVLVYDDFAATGPQAPTRTYTPAMGGEKISVNLHGIDYDLATDQLLLSDVGSAASPSDGQLFTIENASTAMGLTEVKWQVGGDQTILGNPVDVVLSNGAAYVAEKSNDAVLKYDNVFARMGSANGPADASITVIKAESVDVVR
ncbi:MAG: hypothetical protein AAGG50_15110, partial [Bacteroidota bacterium]